MKVVRTERELIESAPAGCLFVPTMGALHRGHGSLVERACGWRREHGSAEPVVVSVFVNPTQFNDQADLDRYPRTPEADVALCRSFGADIVFMPEEGEVYPVGRSLPAIELPPAATLPGLEDAFRPGHFEGVCQVVARLFGLTRASVAFFGEKDWQQLKVIEALAARLGGPRVVGAPTVREPDGLAMSSRNVFLSADDRRRALAIPEALRRAAEICSPVRAERAMKEALVAAGLDVEYAVVRNAEDLMPFDMPEPEGCRRGRSLIAARAGTVRLIDNAAWGEAF